MKLTVSDKAIQWFEDELMVEEGQGVQFFGKTYGKTEVHEGFSVGMKTQDPNKHEILGKYEENGRTYFASKEDDWFFNPYDLEVDFDPEAEVPLYHFSSNDN